MSRTTPTPATTPWAGDKNQGGLVQPLRTIEVIEGDMSEFRVYYLLLAACAVSVCLPIWLVKYPPLVDYPNSLARTYILYHLNEYNFTKYFTVSWKPLPNLAIDAVVVPLQTILDIEVAGKTFLTAIVILFAIGCHRVGRQIHGHPTWLAPCCSLFVTNSMFLWGWVNYIAGMGLYLVAFASWLGRRRNWTPGGCVMAAVLALACYLAHLSALAFLGVSIVVVTAFDCVALGRPDRRMLLGFSPLVIPTCLYLGVRKDGGVGDVNWGTVLSKAASSLSLMSSYTVQISIICGVGVLVAIFLLILRGRNLRVWWPTFAVGLAFGVLFIIHPKDMLKASGVDARYVPVAVVMMMLSLRGEIPRRVGVLALAIFLGAMAVRQAEIWHVWVDLSRRTEAQLSLSDRIPQGSRILPVIRLPEGAGNGKLHRPFMHTPLYMTIYRRCFVTTLFADRGVAFLHFKSHPEYFGSDPFPPLANQKKWRELLKDYDLIWAYNADEDHTDFFGRFSSQLGARGGVTLFRIRHDR